MKWFGLTAVYATVLTLPGHWIAPAYQRLLLGLTGLMLGVSLPPPPDGSVDLSASNALTIYVALCLASGFASWPRRLAAVLPGLLLLIAIECGSGMLGIYLALHSSAASLGWHRSWEQALELVRWLAVPMAWGALLGHRALTVRRASSARTPEASSSRHRGRITSRE